MITQKPKNELIPAEAGIQILEYIIKKTKNRWDFYFSDPR
jgi:hypothetical protein